MTDNNGLEAVSKRIAFSSELVNLFNTVEACPNSCETPKQNCSSSQGIHTNKDAKRDLEHASMISLKFSVIIQPYPKSCPLSLFVSYGTSIDKESRSPILFSA